VPGDSDVVPHRAGGVRHLLCRLRRGATARCGLFAGRAAALWPALLNTLLLIAGSATVAAAVRALRQPVAAGRLLATLLGGSFVLLCWEFAGKFAAGITLSSSDSLPVADLLPFLT
jgi:heme/copper-type cytochrome/quinol oxidase subunit 3